MDSESQPSELSTRERILEAALGCFAAHGPLGARVDAIAAAAGVNKRMLYHYFGDKAGLFQAVLDERVVGCLAIPVDPGDMAWLADINADQWRMLAWQAQESDQWDIGAVVQRVAAGQRAGDFRDDVSAQVIALCLLGAHALPKLLGPVAEVGDPRQLRVELADLVAPLRHGGPRPRVRIKPTVQAAASGRIAVASGPRGERIP